MRAWAPGKIVLSGAYVVLDGAPGVVAAVDRYAVADTDEPADFIGDELRAAFGDAAVPRVDTSSMRAHGRKLGLGSSAAAVVAALGARRLAASPPPALDGALRAAVCLAAYEAHRRAQGGGSGIDVVAAAFGGVRVCEVQEGGPPRHHELSLSGGLQIEVWACPGSASTAALLGPVRALRAADPGRYGQIVAPAIEGARLCAENGGALSFLEGARLQREAMIELGDAVGAPILPGYLRELHDLTAPHAVVFQAGAGGGDVALHLGLGPSSPGFRNEAETRGLWRLDLALGARGLHTRP
jgi:phosphomevalonate kinase